MRLERVRSRFARRAPRQGLPRFVFVVTYGRSGSTLIQGLLNALPGTLVRGENGLFVLHSYRAWAAVRDFKQQNDRYAARAKRVGRPATSAFYGLDDMRLAAFVTSTRQLVVHQLYGQVDSGKVDVLGFKEVRWHQVAPRETEDFFTFFDKLFPDARYVLNQRNHAQVATSGFWRREKTDHVMTAIQRVEEVQAHLRATRPGRALDIRYENLTSDDAAVVDRELRSLAEFTLDRPCEKTEVAAMRATLATGHGPNPFGKSRKRKPRAATA